jgi:hypothetical protein
MEIARPDVAGAAAKQVPGESGAAPGGKSFDDVMAHVDGSQIKMHSPEEVVPSLQVKTPERAAEIRADKLKIAEAPDGVQKLGAELEKSTARLREIVGQLQGGQTFTPQELLGMQAEMNDISLQIEVTTKVVAETVSGVRQLLQQQA